MNRTDRLFSILLHFQARRTVRAEDLARQFEVSVRTIYRDVAALSESGVPIAALPGTGYRLLDGYFLPPLALTADEATILHLGATFVRDRVDPNLRRAAELAVRKLESVLRPAQQEAIARRGREIFFAGGDKSDGPNLAELRTAIEQRRVVRLRYHAARRAGPEDREVEPVMLVHLSGRWHLAAYCRLRQAPRFFRLDRIDRFDPLGEQFILSERHQMTPDSGQPADLPEARVRFDLSVARWVRERQPYTFQREELTATGLLCVYALRDEGELLAWLLGWGAAVEVLSPSSLRARLVAEARALLARHGEDRN